MDTITPTALQALLLAEPATELSLLDVRETRYFVQRHPNLARNVPFSGLELQIEALVPRRTTPVVLYDDHDASDGVAQAAAIVLNRLGYTDVRTLNGGLQRWLGEGLPAIDGYGTLVKAFGDRARLHYGTPGLPIEALRERQREGRPTTLVDARPHAEFRFLSLPGARNHAGTELALRRFEADEADHLWAINCFSRTRGIVGATTLRLLGRAPDAVFLEDGVMAWGLQGAPTVQNAAPDDELPPESPEVLRRIADDLIGRFGLPLVDAAQLARWRDDDARTLYVFDVRPAADPALSGTDVRQVPGGQLLMHFENLVGTRGARIVLLDDQAHRLRAAITSFWLTQLNQAEVYILDGELAPDQAPPAPGTTVRDAPVPIAADALARLRSDGVVTVIDVGPSLDYERGHLPGALYMLPASLAPLAEHAAPGRTLVFTSPDGVAAARVARDARQRWQEDSGAVFTWLQGGTQGWGASGRPLSTDYVPPQLLTPFDDDWGSVMRVFGPRRDAAWADYLAWERALAERVLQDPSVRFRFFALSARAPA
ncbi:MULTISPECIES: rhodanese-like domain-containing protein [Variovorax]|jgi:rhodanese-related sulfurtransferase|uniref:rhodanese-like domain-containing protein n=1 Tax=Variovorax TaxID=34072 RepID=UPI00086A389A|nr:MULTISPECIES: rhodanese-like domain-containing protein [Variovorax]MBN8755320.1 rhodanese [Variovorax sp.]ODU15932.1 MAG: rhodanese [Variovorax sp. SCN 67-85]ODV21309.1 MAG: rhodanese [Variovorax sp. SCN 67-20]OJZ14129.1 MAG: rhodanese [Variovorax sp. 67-131]UKI08474.1 rhodanese [Variovorax paradoxus]